MTKLQEALRRYAQAHGAAAANALIIASAQDGDLAWMGEPLRRLRTVSDGRPVGLGADLSAEIVEKMGRLMAAKEAR